MTRWQVKSRHFLSEYNGSVWALAGNSIPANRCLHFDLQANRKSVDQMARILFANFSQMFKHEVGSRLELLRFVCFQILNTAKSGST